MKRAALLFALFSAAPAFAQTPRDTKPATPPAPPVRYVPVQHFEFEPEFLEGTRVGPDGENVVVRRRAVHEGMIKPRESFVAEMIRSAEDI